MNFQAIAAFALVGANAYAQVAIDQHGTDAGAVSSAGTFQMVSIVGQPDAGPSSNGLLKVTGGFLSAGEDTVLAVSLLSFRVTTKPDSSHSVEWVTASELDNVGFNVLPALITSQGGYLPGVPVNPATILSESSDGSGATYQLQVAAGQAAVGYYLEDIDVSGRRTLHGPAFPPTRTQVADWQLF